MKSLVPFLLIVVCAVVAEKNGGSGNNIYITIMDGKGTNDDDKMMKPPGSNLVLGDSMDDPVVVQDICLLGPIQKDRFNYCHASILRYTFDVSTGRCNQFIYGGCFGTENLFRTKRLCEQKCAHLIRPAQGGEKPGDESSEPEEEDYDEDETPADIIEN